MRAWIHNGAMVPIGEMVPSGAQWCPMVPNDAMVPTGAMATTIEMVPKGAMVPTGDMLPNGARMHVELMVAPTRLRFVAKEVDRRIPPRRQVPQAEGLVPPAWRDIDANLAANRE